MTSPWAFTLRITPSDHNENGRVCVSDHNENGRVCVGRVPWGQPDENDKGIAAHKTTIKIIFLTTEGYVNESSHGIRQRIPLLLRANSC